METQYSTEVQLLRWGSFPDYISWYFDQWNDLYTEVTLLYKKMKGWEEEEDKIVYYSLYCLIWFLDIFKY